MTTLRLALAQLNPTVGDLRGNAAKIVAAFDAARAAGAALVVVPELAICGYPPEDLLLRPDFIRACGAALRGLLPHTAGLTAIVGFPEQADDLYNAAAVLHDGQLAGIYRKHRLPTYAVFDEDRTFRAGDTESLFALPLPGEDGRSVRLGITICEDIWYPDGPQAAQADAGAELLINLSASPYQHDKIAARSRMLATRAADAVSVVALCNLVGGQDELIFDGSSAVYDATGRLLGRAASFEETVLVVDVPLDDVFRRRLRDPRRRKNGPAEAHTVVELAPIAPGATSDVAAASGAAPEEAALAVTVNTVAPLLAPLAEVYRALLLATRDYVHKNGFRHVVLGLSGGVDSALVATLAADALGPAHVTAVSMPSRYSSDHSRSDAATLARNLGIDYRTVAIEPAFQAYLDILADELAGTEPDTTEENIQARIRGNVLMALSNKFGWLVLTTGNKSEMAVGYATLYGDMAGGFAVIKDVSKTLVYDLCRYRNETIGPAIPASTLTKPPSAELRPDQKDTDSLPPYDVLDPILQAFIEEECSAAEIIAAGHDPAIVARVVQLVTRTEYKRRQAPPGPRITTKAFGKDRRLPITNRFRSAGVPA